jgi:hypothetical protein
LATNRGALIRHALKVFLESKGIYVGAREHRASYLRTGQISAHASCE